MRASTGTAAGHSLEKDRLLQPWADGKAFIMLTLVSINDGLKDSIKETVPFARPKRGGPVDIQVTKR